MRDRLRSPAAGIPIGVLAGMAATGVLWPALRHVDPSHTPASALVVAGGLGVVLAATIATVWYGLASTRDDR